MGVVKQKKTKAEKNVANGKQKDDKKVKKKKIVSCLQCIKANEDGGLEGKYRVAAPELMQDTFMSDSEDEGGEVECPIQQQQQYRYMNSEAGTLNRARPLEDSVTDGHLWPSNNDRKVATIERQPVDIGFLVSFVVDARGGAMKAKRRGGVRIIVPPAACAAPTRVTCRAATRRAPAAAPPPLMEGEALASRLLELQPQGAKFLAPVIIEVPIFTTSCKEREIVILRSDTGETWQDHYLHNNDNPLIQEALQRERLEYGPSGEAIGEHGERVTRIVTCEFPHYLACVSRIRQEVHVIGPEGGAVSSAHVPQVQALFPAQALTKRIRVGVQAHGPSPALCKRVLPRHVPVSPVVTVEPRRRKFHRSITLTVPLPQSHDDTMEKCSTSNLRLLCSIMGGQARAVWEDVTGSTPLTITADCASFTTTVSARFWLMNCQNVSDATKLATELYREMLLVPFEVRIVVLGKRLDALEGRLLVMTITDRYAYETLLQQEHYTEVAHSTSVRLLDGKDVYLEFSGNLVPVTKSGSQPMITFEAFKDNRVEFTVRVKHHEETPSGRIYFMNEPKVPKGEQSQTPTCVLDVQLPERIAPRAGKSQVDYLNLDQSGFDALKDELSFNWGDHNNSLGPASGLYQPDRPLNGHAKIITNGGVKYPTKENEDKDPKPQVNGNTLHVDSNKTKATFDSDEDKTPQNTLEKGKKKPETSFLGGLADKVKNVFSHSEDKEDDVKESSPTKPAQPQPKPRETKEKSPPKPAPRIINEDLLDKVEDMFKDLNQKPPRKDDDDPNSEIYATKLIVDEDERPALSDIKEEIYDEYAKMQPVDTPLYSKKTDPFQFYVGCCEGKFNKGQKHRHDETSNLVDRIEQVNFATHEIEKEYADGLEKIEKEKDNIKQQSGDFVDDLHAKTQDKIKGVEESVHGKLDALNDSARKLKESANHEVSEADKGISDRVDDVKSSAQEAVDSIITSAGAVKDNLNMKALSMDFAARELEEELKLREQAHASELKKAANDSIDNLKNKSEELSSNVAQKAKESADAAVDSLKKAQDSATEKVQDVKTDVKGSFDKAKESTNEKLQALGDSVENTKKKSKKAAADLKADAQEVKEEIKKEGKKKSKQGKNFFTGLVHNIFGEKDKIEDEVKGKLAAGKDSANELLKEASDKKDAVSEEVSKKQEELKDGANQIVQNLNDKADETEKALLDKKDELQETIQIKFDDAKDAVNDKVNDVKSTAVNKTTEIKDSINDKVEDTKTAVNEQTDNIKDALNDTKDNVCSKVNEVKDAVADKAEDAKKKAFEVKESIETKANELKDAAATKTAEISDAVKSKTSEVQDAVVNTSNEIKENVDQTKDAVLSKAAEIQESAKNKANDAKQAVEDKTKDVKNAVLDTTAKAQEAVSDAKNAVQNKANEVTDTLQQKATEYKEAAYQKGSEVNAAVAGQVSDAKQAVETKTNEVADAICDTANQTKDAIYNTTSEVKNSAQNKIQEAVKAVSDTTEAVGTAIVSKKDDLEQLLLDKKDQVKNVSKSEFERIKQEAEATTDQIKKSAEDTLNGISSKQVQFRDDLEDKFDDIKQRGQGQWEDLQQTAGDWQDSSKQALGHIQDSTFSTFDKVESSAKGKVSDAKDTWEDLQSTTRDTFADFKDDVGNSTQDTLRSFQSSAGDTFDSLDDSTREVFGSVQTAAGNAESGTKELFGDMKDSFEGFQVSADNKLEDVKGSAKDRLEEVGERLGEATESIKEDVKLAEKAVADSVASEADKFTSSLNNLGSSVFGSSGKGFMKDSSTKLLESEKAQSSPQKKNSGFFSKLRRN